MIEVIKMNTTTIFDKNSKEGVVIIDDGDYVLIKKCNKLGLATGKEITIPKNMATFVGDAFKLFPVTETVPPEKTDKTIAKKK